MDYIFRKDVNSNWHIDGVESGSKHEHRLCRRLSRRYFGGELIADTPNMLVESVVRIRTPKWYNLPTLMESCSELVFYDFDGCVYFFFNDKKYTHN